VGPVRTEAAGASGPRFHIDYFILNSITCEKYNENEEIYETWTGW